MFPMLMVAAQNPIQQLFSVFVYTFGLGEQPSHFEVP